MDNDVARKGDLPPDELEKALAHDKARKAAESLSSTAPPQPTLAELDVVLAKAAKALATAMLIRARELAERAVQNALHLPGKQVDESVSSAVKLQTEMTLALLDAAKAADMLGDKADLRANPVVKQHLFTTGGVGTCVFCQQPLLIGHICHGQKTPWPGVVTSG